MTMVIIGNSAAALNAVEQIRKRGSNDEIIMISKEKGRPYSRVLLPYYLRGKFQSKENIFIRDCGYYEDKNIKYIEDEVIGIDEINKKVILKDSHPVIYNKLLITSGSSPFKPPIEGLENEGVYHMWTLDDVNKLEPYFKKGNKVLVLGSGFVSLQAAWTALCKGLDVYVYELMPCIMPRVLDTNSAQILTNQMRKLGVKLELQVSTEKIEKLPDGKLKVCAKDKEDIIVDFIIVGTGVRPNVQFTQNTSIKTDRGILVNEYMETSIEHIYAAGDVAQGPTAFGDKHMIHALWPTAVEQGKAAGVNMIGEKEPYKGSLSMNVTQMFNITVASMGNFSGNENSLAWDYDLKEEGTFKLVLQDGVPIGASIIGKSELVEFLGILRPIMRNKREIHCEKKDLFQYLRSRWEV